MRTAQSASWLARPKRFLKHYDLCCHLYSCCISNDYDETTFRFLPWAPLPRSRGVTIMIYGGADMVFMSVMCTREWETGHGGTHNGTISHLLVAILLLRFYKKDLL